MLGLPYFVFLAFFLVSIVVSMSNLHWSNVDCMIYLSSQFARDPMAMPMEWGRQIPILPVFICTVPLDAGTASLVAPCLKLWVRLVSPILTFLIGDSDSCQSSSSRLQCPLYAFCLKVLTCPLEYISNCDPRTLSAHAVVMIYMKQKSLNKIIGSGWLGMLLRLGFFSVFRTFSTRSGIFSWISDRYSSLC